MKKMSKQHFFRSEANSPLRQILEDLKQSEGQSLQKELADALLILHYPRLLQKQGATAEQIQCQAELSIRRLSQEINQLTALVNSLSNPSSDLASATEPRTLARFEELDGDEDDANEESHFNFNLSAKDTF
ncbi:hypothetical protein NIES970_29180 (plasmid) [[Synechococcus] sp. NIES-970]|nr:hypothetical protein NIES970_28440 [[Synechococcus] sp. NIES-970]BAW97955.1 hypothetical protein NIES970_29180 [[Synechococcus] sp. NIES-970]